MPTKGWKNHPQKLLRKTQLHFFFFTAWAAKRPKQENSCSKMWVIDQLYIGLGTLPCTENYLYLSFWPGKFKKLLSKAKLWKFSPKQCVIDLLYIKLGLELVEIAHLRTYKHWLIGSWKSPTYEIKNELGFFVIPALQ